MLGSIVFIAAGPGDPELLTMRAVRLLQKADKIVSDLYASHIAATYVNADKVVIAVGEDEQELEPAEAAKLVLELARESDLVVRLVLGDPIVSGALIPEISVLRRSHASFELVPGVSEVTGIPAFAGFNLTGGKTHEVRILDAQDPGIEWETLMSPRQTLVFLKGGDLATTIADKLIKAGRDLATPIAITRNGTTVDQRTTVSTLGGVGALLKNSKDSGPGFVVVGEVIDQREKYNWFEKKELVGWRVLIPRTQDNTAEMMQVLKSHGAVPSEVATISVEPPRTPQQMDRAVNGLVSGRYAWVGFTSLNAVRAIREKLEEYGLDARSFSGLKVAAVGASTIAALIDFGVKPDLVPPGDQNTTALMEEWPPYDSLLDPINRIFLPRADISTDTLVAGLIELGWEVEDITAFRTVRAAPPPAHTREAIKTGGFDAVLFTSSSTVRNLVGIAGKPHATTVVACIGPQTAKTAAEHGLRVDVLAEVNTPLALVDALSVHAESLREAALDSGEVSWRPSRRRPVARRKSAK
ncbi:bifunctional uroporphyrinogen-III C-methyltransferase/uroporphyrinogen-III synthase [Actinomycetota bacterium]|nr:bifunctional uroporphyrinogen-III C-methyltransferase/uroporphyrinogen-III synthase [Actinomycetota bacterium]